MKMLIPVDIDPATGMTSSTVPETDYAVWVATTSYTVGDRVIRTQTHMIYESVTGGVSATPPESALGGVTPQWIEVRSTNRWSMFNDRLTEPTTSASDITVIVKPGPIDGIALMGVVGESLTVEITDNATSVVIFTETTELESSYIADIYDWFFTEPEYNKDTIVFQGLPIGFADVSVSITITATPDSVASCGACKMGRIESIGDTQYGATAEIIDYSVESIDRFGYMEIVERGFTKSINFKTIVDNALFNKIFKAVSARRARPTVYITTDAEGLEQLIVYGLFYSFSLDVQYIHNSYCTMTVHGMVQA